MIRLRIDKVLKYDSVNLTDELIGLQNPDDELKITINDKVVFQLKPQNQIECLEDINFSEKMNKTHKKVNISGNNGQINIGGPDSNINATQTIVNNEEVDKDVRYNKRIFKIRLE